MKLSERLKELRSKHKYTQQEVSDMVGVSRPTYSGWETGKQGSIEMPLLIRLHEIYGVSVDYLLGFSDCTTCDNELISKETGLSDKAIKELRKKTAAGLGETETLNAILESKFGTDLLYGIRQYLNPDFTVPMDIEGKRLKDNLLWLGRTDDGKDGYTAVEVNSTFLETLAKETINKALINIKNDYSRKQRKEGKR